MKNVNKVFIVIVFLIVTLLTFNSHLAAEANFPSGGTANEELRNSMTTIWSSIVKIIQILAFGSILFAGLRYMFAAPDARADIKKSMGILALGGIIVFGTSSLVDFIITTANSMLM